MLSIIEKSLPIKLLILGRDIEGIIHRNLMRHLPVVFCIIRN